MFAGSGIEKFFFADNFTAVYQCQFKLALYFQEKGDKWLADHFFASCLKTSSNVHGDEGKMAAQSHCNVGMSLEESGLYSELLFLFVYPVKF